MEKQSLNEVYSNELLEAYQKISDKLEVYLKIRDKFAACTRLMRKRIPYETWPTDFKIADVSDDLTGSADGGEHKQVIINPPQSCIPDFPEQLSKHASKIAKHLEESLKVGWKNVQPDCRPDQSFRAMIQVMHSWIIYMENKEKPLTLAQEKLKSILDDDHLMKKDRYWQLENELTFDRSQQIRTKIACLNDNLWDLWNILTKLEAK